MTGTLEGMSERKPKKVAAAALANRMARRVRVLARRKETYTGLALPPERTAKGGETGAWELPGRCGSGTQERGKGKPARLGASTYAPEVPGR